MRLPSILKIASVLLSLSVSLALSAGVPVIPAPAEAQMTDKVFNKKYLDRVKYVRAPELPAEGYELQIRKNRIVIRSSDEAGRFYAQQTLRQLAGAGEMYRGVVRDTPRYPWRGFMLDEARHFFGKQQVKEILDLMARYKLNRFHWHLSDDQGWRVEIKAYPELCTVGGVGCHSDANAPARYYTQEEILEIVAYAAERHIEVIPEIDMPGHATAFTKTFPGLAAGARTVNPADEKLYDVLETVIRELADLFPGRYIHIGGDEVSTRGWRELPEMKEFMDRNGIASYDDIQKVFERRLSAIVAGAGKVAITWDDAVDSGLAPESTLIHWWRADHPESLDKALAAGYGTIVSPWDPFYLDYIQDIRCKEGHLAWEKYVNGLDEIYSFPVREDPSVIGLQANLWTERVRTGERLDYMVFPRLIAIAERAWSQPSVLSYEDFLERLGNEYRFLDSADVFYYDFRDFDRHSEPMK